MNDSYCKTSSALYQQYSLKYKYSFFENARVKLEGREIAHMQHSIKKTSDRKKRKDNLI